jgi:glycosyltransferase involved in cell wall biosynthesis
MPNFSLKAAWFLLFRPFKKWIISHNDISLSRKSRVKIKITRLLIKLASHNISVSKYIGNYINTNSKIIYNCYDDETFKVYNDEVRKYEIVFLGRLVSQKGCELLIKACATLSCSFTLNVIGNGPERNKLERMVKELCLEKNVHFLGVLEGEQLARVLNRHYIMIIPSMEEEGFGIVALEGMACGCKIIAANAGGLSEAVNGFGKLFEMGNLHQLEKLLKTLLEELRVTTSSEQTANLNEYLAVQSKKAVADKYLELFLEG